MSRRSRLLSAATLTTALAATALTGSAGSAGAALTTPGTALADDAAPVLTLTTPDRVRGYAFRKRAYIELGLHAVTGDDALEIRSKRARYDEPITTTWTAGTRTGSLPAGTQKNFRGLSGFATVKIRDLDGDVADKLRIKACFGNGGSRVRPDGDAANPYPWGCPWNPYTLGSVQGIPGGWGVPLGGYDGSIRARVDAGEYDVTVKVRDVYADAFGLSAAERRVTTRLVVKGEERRKLRRTSADERRGDEAPLQAGPRPERASAGETDGPRPDLRSLPAFGLTMNRKGTRLRFGANVWNAGPSPLLVDGFRRDGEDVMDAYQYFFDADGNQVGYEQVGEMHFHKGNHRHWHFEDFARYRLLDADKQPVARSRKVSFCLANTDAVDYTVPGADWHPESTDLATACGSPSSLSVREVLSSGSGDTYYQYRSGQAIKVEGLPNGTYYLEVEANPFGRLLESDTTNNASLRRLRLGGKPGNRRVKTFQVGIVDERGRFFF